MIPRAFPYRDSHNASDTTTTEGGVRILFDMKGHLPLLLVLPLMGVVTGCYVNFANRLISNPVLQGSSPVHPGILKTR